MTEMSAIMAPAQRGRHIAFGQSCQLVPGRRALPHLDMRGTPHARRGVPRLSANVKYHV